jgi:DNA-binding transcriptional MocR family regulator
MPRATIAVWFKHIVSKDGPAERLRHAAHILRLHLHDDGIEGCFPSQRRVGLLMGVDHKTAAKALNELYGQGWVDREKVPRQFGRKGFRYFPAIPQHIGEPRDSPIHPSNGDTQVPQSVIGESPINGIGESMPGIGESESIIGDTQVPRNLTEAIAECAASPSPHAADSAALTETEVTRNKAKLRAISKQLAAQSSVRATK